MTSALTGRYGDHVTTRPRNEAFIRLRKAAGLTQRGLVAEYTVTAQRIGVRGTVSERTVARWESADPPCPAPAQQQVLESLFGVPLEEMGFEVPEHRRVGRRQFLADVGAISAAGLIPSPDRERARVDAGDLRRLDDDAEAVYRVDHSRGSGGAYVLAEQLAARITGLLSGGSYLAAVGDRLHASLGAVTSHLGWLSYDAARLDAARTHCLEALAAARLSGDRHLEARALASLSLVAVEQGRAWEAASATTAAWSAVGRFGGATVRAMMCAREAGALAAGGDLSGARRALSQAMANHDRSGRDEPPRWAVFFGPAELDQAMAEFYLASGKPAAAASFFRQTVNSLGDGYARNGAMYRAKLARALLAAGEVEEACVQAEAVAAHIGEVDSARTLALLRRFRADLAAVDSPPARDCSERLDAALGTTR
jgi:transcriptional regulator with XRE-family HTH domain